MKNKSLLPILLLAAFALGACNLPGGSSQAGKESEQPQTSISGSEDTSEDTTQYGVAIANKAALQEEFYAGDNRDLDITLTPAANALAELGKNLTVVSSDPETVKVTGLGLSALKVGTATITVKYHNAQDTVELTILENSAKGRYGVAHAGTADDPFTNEEALIVAKSPKYANDGGDYYVRGVVDSFYHAPGSRTDGACSFFLKPAQENGERFEIYKCYKEGKGEASYLTADDIWKNGTVTAHGTFTSYNGQYETTSAIFVSCEGNKPQPPQIIEKTFAEALALGVALKDGDDSYDSIKFQGYVSAKSGNNYFLTATKGEELVSGKSDAAHGEKDVYTNAIELYNAGKVEALAAKLLEGAKVEVTAVLKNYHGTVENGKDLVDADVTVIEAGTAWSVPEPDVANKTLAEFIALENKADKAYNVTAQIKAFKTGATKDAYGNMTITDGTNDLVIYGSTLKADALAWDNAGAYAFTNPQDFLKTPATAALKVGNTITMKLIRADYTKDGTTTIQGKGVITNIVAVAATGIQLDKATAEIEVDEKLTLTATVAPADSNSVVEWISSDDTKATVENGVVTGVAAGEVTISAKISDAIKADCVVTVKAPAVVENSIKLTAQNLLGYAGTNVAYPSDSTPVTATISEAGFAAVGCGAYGSGIQMRTKNGIVSAIYNTTELNIEKLSMEWAAGQAVTAGKDYNVWVEFSNKADFSELVGTKQNVKFDDTSKLAEATPTAPAKYFKVSHANQGAVYIDLIKVVLGEGSGTDPQPEIAQPTGAFRGLAKSKAGTFLPVDMVLAADSVTLSANGEAVAVTSYEWDKVEGQITIVTDAAGYGTIVAKLDAENNLFQITSINGTAALASLDLTYAVKLSGKCQFLDCEGSTAELQAMFLRRKMGSSGWEAANADDKIFSSENGKNGKGLSVKCWADGKIALTMKNDVNIPAASIKSVGCWIYNPSSTAYSTNLYFYPSAGNKDGKMVKTISLPAGQWTFCECGVAGGSFGDSNTFYNFQFYTENVNTTLVFDNFCIYM